MPDNQVSRREMIDYLVKCCYPGVLREHGSYATAFRAELNEQPLRVVVAMYESAHARAVAKEQARLKKLMKRQGAYKGP
jgi:hypothetical protein